MNVSIGNLDAIFTRYRTAASDLNDTLDRATEIAAQAVAAHTIQMPPVSAKTTGYGAIGIPVDTGSMRQAIVTEKKRFLAAGVVANTNYSALVERGTSKMPARPFFQWSLQTGGSEIIKQVFQEQISRLLSA